MTAEGLVATAGAPTAQFCLSRLAGSLPGVSLAASACGHQPVVVKLAGARVVLLIRGTSSVVHLEENMGPGELYQRMSRRLPR